MEVAKTNGTNMPTSIENYPKNGRQKNELRIWDNYHKPISKQQVTKNEIGTTVLSIMAKYGRNNPDKGAAKFITEEIQENWSHFAIDDLNVAFLMWSKGEIGDKSADYYGEWNVLIFNRILSAYETHRRKVINELAEQTKNNDEMQKEKERFERECFEKNYAEEVKKILSLAQSWRDIPVWVYESLTARKLLELENSEKAAIMEKANKLYFEELEQERRTTADRGRYKEISNMLENLIPGHRAKMIAKRIEVFENIKNIEL
jgi:flagellar biosynthesis GTPase FlhF